MRQYKALIIVMFFLSVFSFSKVNAHIKNYSLLGKTIFLDAGHGGVDAGATSSTFLEKDMNLLLVNKLAVELVNRGAIVFLTRDGDYDLSTTTINRKRRDLYSRVKLINNSKSDLYISIHMNSSPSRKWNGIQIFYSNILSDNKEIAKILTNELKSNMKNIRDYKKENNYYMYSKLKVPGVLVEAGFISNSNDNYKIRQTKYQKILIENIANGIEKYLSN
jgi:N-acetylmuramoyl-L-alanine amidase